MLPFINNTNNIENENKVFEIKYYIIYFFYK